MTTHTVTVTEATQGQRLDRLLADALALSRSRVKALIESGHAARAGATVTEPAAPVRPGAYTLTVPPPAPAAPEQQPRDLTILDEDSDLIVLDKPPGLVVHPAPGNQDNTLVNALLAHCPDLPGIGGEQRPGIVHRLDKDTSGVMVVAKTDRAHTALSAAFAERRVEREYAALVWGWPAPPEGDIEGDIGRDPRDRKRMAVVRRNGKPALTHYRTDRVWPGVALLRVRLATGRTHQIRVHLAARGHPVVGDPVYLRRVPAAARDTSPAVRARLLDFPRQALHAAVLGFVHPVTGDPLRFETAPPDDMASLLAAMTE